MKTRPHAQIRPWTWMDGDDKTPGVGIFHGQNLMAHLSHEDARKAADIIHDICDKLENQTNTTNS